MTVFCRCFDVEKSRVVDAIEDGCRTVEAVKDRLGVSGHCAACRPDIEDLLAFYAQYPGTSEDPRSPLKTPV
jgi:nitrite reductase (NADH) large subunit